MNKIFIMLTAIVVSINAFGQNKYYGRVISENKAGLSGATITSVENPENGVVADFDGNFEILLRNTNKVKISYVGFESKITKLTKTFNTIILNEAQTGLEEVVISASRELQKRSEVPASISTISARQIQESKAFGLEQLVNEVPGVFMSTSKAAGNEQHFMSVRSPISTRSIFLYLEDGLPIRPTAVFNHNSLLEINNTSLQKIEVLKGPASSIYGSEAIGASFNFITQDPTFNPSGSLGFQLNDLGLSRYEAEYSQYLGKKVGFYVGSQYVQRKNGPIEYSDYEKFGLTFKSKVNFSSSLEWTNVLDLINYRSDMTGSLGENDFRTGEYLSDQTFTNRTDNSLRLRSTLDKEWNSKNKTTFNFIFRDNTMGQIPSYRVTQFREQGQLTGSGSGEINSNGFNSYVGIIQHKTDFKFWNSTLITGVSLDYSPQKYFANPIQVQVDVETHKNTGYTIDKNNFLLNYRANILNYAGYAQYEISPIQKLKVTGAIRFDKFQYDYNNLIEDVAGPEDAITRYQNWSPKIGFNYNFSKALGIYGNYAVGFTPPETSNLYRNSFVGAGGRVFDLKPSNYNNYELGGYFNLPSRVKLDLALYMLNGKNTLISLRNGNDEFYYTNAGKTRSYGIEYGVTYFPVSSLRITHSGSLARHRYIKFFQNGVDYSGTDRETAPRYTSFTEISYHPSFLTHLNISANNTMVGRYNTSFEGQVISEDGGHSTATYKGYSIFNLKASYTLKRFEFWGQVLNIFDSLYAVEASYNIYRKENSYTIGNPRAFHLGVKYNF
ncbi:TonB-dependent receptor [Christiangramia fulva]|uniref:TonB-dependent receptor n=1 Tax=Christiangramia fulva TaxID=2126553 RepID=A0A2R3Z1U4_9FLAO|nr:TonB-dependent receptor [Christiangramia fulva]AVR44212.1 TonB-dependent receptor [Christiangramia fulva]